MVRASFLSESVASTVCAFDGFFSLLYVFVLTKKRAKIEVIEFDWTPWCFLFLSPTHDIPSAGSGTEPWLQHPIPPTIESGILSPISPAFFPDFFVGISGTHCNPFNGLYSMRQLVSAAVKNYTNAISF